MRWLPCLVLAGCAAEEPFDVWSGEYPASIDVVVTDRWVQVHAPTAGSVFAAFTPPGSCIVTSDAGPSEGSCLRHISVDDIVVDWPMGGASASLERTNPHEIVIDGCGDRIVIPLSTRAAPTPSLLTHERDAESITVAWTTDRPATSALVQVGTGYVSHICHTTRSSYAFPLDESYPVRSTAVFTFAVPDEIVTRFGVVHVWYAGVVADDAMY